jgi:hypothetical protein
MKEVTSVELSVQWRMTGEMKYLENLPQSTLFTTSPTWPDLGSNPVRRGGKSATNRLSYATALVRNVTQVLKGARVTRVEGWLIVVKVPQYI